MPHRIPCLLFALTATCSAEAMRLLDAANTQPIVPVLTRKAANPVLCLTLTTSGSENPISLDAVEIDLTGTISLKDIDRVDLLPGPADPNKPCGQAVATAKNPGAKLVLQPGTPLAAGANTYWVSIVLKDQANPDNSITIAVNRIKVGGTAVKPTQQHPPQPHPIGIGLRLHGDDGSKFYRIPGLTITKAGTLLAAYDVRYRHSGDLPADIDVGTSRSTDGGRTWQPMRIAIDMGKDPQYGYDGVGDAAVLADPQTGRLWIAAFWCHGKHGWNDSGPGISPDETGQLVLVHSDDDGLTWSKPRNLTPEIKNPAWRLMFNGPGRGITTRDGTLVFAAQFRAADGGDTQGKPFSTLLTSKDQGVTWTIGTGIKIDTTEAQVVELADGSLMLNCRDNRGGSRTVGTTRDLGQSWQLHPTDRKALPESVCMASLIRWQDPRHGPLLAFSNPATTRGRHHMTLKLSTDEGLTWPESKHLIYDERSGAGYSCLTRIDDTHLGVLYEGQSELYFLRIPIAGFFR